MSLVAHDIAFAYPGREPLYDGFSLEVEPGERVALVAPSGRGKTTLCRILAGQLEPQRGEILVDGEPLLGRRPSGRRALPVQLVSQHPELAFDPRMRMGASLAEGAAGLSIADALDRAEKTGLRELLGIREEWLSRFPHELSGGELMRFCIARALLAEPRYLLCDEMTAMLDAVTQAEIWHRVLAIARERAIGLVVVSHSPALLAKIATRQCPLSGRR